MMSRGMTVVLLLCSLATTVSAAPDMAGRYRCLSYNVSGGGGSCRLAPPLMLNRDGSYTMSRERGTWRVAGDRVHLSESKIRGPGRIARDGRIVFEYTYGGRRHTVTYGCTDCPGAR